MRNTVLGVTLLFLGVCAGIFVQPWIVTRDVASGGAAQAQQEQQDVAPSAVVKNVRANSDTLRVLSEIGGGRQLMSYIDTERDEALLSTIEKNRFPITNSHISPDQFMQQLNALVVHEDYGAIAALLPTQGFFSITQSIWSSKQLWQKESFESLVKKPVYLEVLKSAQSYGEIVPRQHPARELYIHKNPEPSLADSKENLVNCKVVNDVATLNQIKALGIYFGLAKNELGTPIELSKIVYACDSSWGGGGITVYIQPAKDTDSYQLLGADIYMWE